MKKLYLVRKNVSSTEFQRLSERGLLIDKKNTVEFSNGLVETGTVRLSVVIPLVCNLSELNDLMKRNQEGAKGWFLKGILPNTKWLLETDTIH